MKQAAVEQLFRKMSFCPMCGGTLVRFGSLGTELKTCDTGCGVMYLRGHKTNTKVGMFLEVSQEKLPK